MSFRPRSRVSGAAIGGAQRLPFAASRHACMHACMHASMHVTECELPAAHVHRGGKPREDNWKRGHVREQDGAE